MKVTKPYIREFKGIPVYISFFIIFKTRRPTIKTAALEITANVNGECKRQVMSSTQELDIGSFFDASLEFVSMMIEKYDEIKREKSE